MKKGVNRLGQIWVETVIYTLIALAMIGAVLAFIVPKIGEIQDKSIIEQSLNAMKDINNVVLSVVQGGPGNKRLVEANIKKGTLKIDGRNDQEEGNRTIFEMETDYVYSEPGTEISIGEVKAITQNIGGTNIITLTTNYNYDIIPNELRIIEHSTTPYTISIENKGDTDLDGKIEVEILVS